MWRIKGYRGKRTDYRYAFKVKLFISKDRWAFSNFQATQPDRIDWCEEHCKGEWSVQGSIFWFDKRNDAVMFKLIWGGR